MIERKIELTFSATRNEWGSTPIRVKTIIRGEDGKILSSVYETLESYLNGTNRRDKMEKAFEDFIKMFYLMKKEKI